MGPPCRAVSLASPRGQAGSIPLAPLRRLGQRSVVGLETRLRKLIKAARKRNSLLVRMLDVVRLLPIAEGRARLFTRLFYRGQVHQTTPYSEEDRYPELFDLVARMAPGTGRILSFGCSTGEELVALRRRFPLAEIVGAEINARSRRIAATRIATDSKAGVVPPRGIEGQFDAIFALAVFQREPHMVEESRQEDLSARYPFGRFDSSITELADRLEAGGLLCVFHNQYRVEDSTASPSLEPLMESPVATGPFFGRDGRRLDSAIARTIFRKRGQGGGRDGAR
jgi:hypothetical protein